MHHAREGRLAAALALLLLMPAQGMAQTPRPPLPLEAIRSFTQVIGAFTSQYVDEVSAETLVQNAILGMLQKTDPHADFLDKEAFQELQGGPGGPLGGLGFELKLSPGNGDIQIVSPIDGTPASRAGLHPGDLIRKIDGKDLAGLSLSATVKLLRGRPGTEVMLSVQKRGETQINDIKLVREVIRITPVTSMLAEADLGYIRIRQFQENTLENFARQLAALYASNKRPLKGLVLDLRNNPGGLLFSSIGLAAAFLPEDAIVLRTEGRNEDSKRTYRASAKDYLRGNQSDVRKILPAQISEVPVVVLVNQGTASGSEIVVAALRDHRRATTIGEKTAGRGSVQTIFPLGGGTALKMTTARMFSPAGGQLESNAIVPDVEIKDSLESPHYASEIDRAYLRALEMLRGRNGG